MRKGQTPPKSEPKTAKHATKPQAEERRNVAYGTPLKTTKWPQKLDHSRRAT